MPEKFGFYQLHLFFAADSYKTKLFTVWSSWVKMLDVFDIQRRGWPMFLTCIRETFHAIDMKRTYFHVFDMPRRECFTYLTCWGEIFHIFDMPRRGCFTSLTCRGEDVLRLWILRWSRPPWGAQAKLHNFFDALLENCLTSV